MRSPEKGLKMSTRVAKLTEKVSKSSEKVRALTIFSCSRTRLAKGERPRKENEE
jgi:hypothetical protein